MHNLYTISNFLRFIPKLAVILTCSRFDYDITPDDKRVLYTYNKRAWSTNSRLIGQKVCVAFLN